MDYPSYRQWAQAICQHAGDHPGVTFLSADSGGNITIICQETEVEFAMPLGALREAAQTMSHAELSYFQSARGRLFLVETLNAGMNPFVSVVSHFRVYPPPEVEEEPPETATDFWDRITGEQ